MSPTEPPKARPVRFVRIRHALQTMRKLLRRVKEHLKLFYRKGLKPHWRILPAVAVLIFVLDWLGWMRGMESYALDTLILSHSEIPSREIVLVVINDQDYGDVFDGISPLDKKKIGGLLEAIQKGSPSLIAVDIDTSHFSVEDFPKVPNIVWARDARSVQARGRVDWSELIPAELPNIFRQFTNEEGHVETTPPTGLSVFPRDPDGVVRRYRRVLTTTDGSSEKTITMDSLPWVIVKTLDESEHDASREKSNDASDNNEHHVGHDLILNFTTNEFHFPKIPAGAVLKMVTSSNNLEAQLKGKIVIVGGTYSAARDLHATPVGLLPGVELIAEAVEAERQKNGIRPFSHALAIFFDLLTGVLFLYLAFLIPFRWSVAISIPLIFVLSLLASLVAFHGFAYWLNFTVVLVGLWIHFLWEKAIEYGHLQEELKALKSVSMFRSEE